MLNCQLSRMSDQRDLFQKDTVTTSLANVERPLWNVRSRPQLWLAASGGGRECPPRLHFY